MAIRTAERFEKAWELCNSLWFPINEEHLDSILTKVESGHFSNDQELLITKVKEDPALFCYCIREVTALMNRTPKKQLRPSQPSKLLYTIELAHLTRILKGARTSVSAHSFTQMSETQAAQLNELLITTSTVEVLSRGAKIDHETGFTTGLLRQLGYTLVAWNYPRVFERAMKRVGKGENKKKVFLELLGFSPYLLGLATATEWGLKVEVKASLGCTDSIEEIKGKRSAELGRTALLLRKFCRVGEQLAQAMNPEQYPTSGADWNEARREIEKALGPDGMVIVQNHVKRACSALATHAPTPLKAIFQENQELDFSVASGLPAYQQNKALQTLPKEIREEFKQLYKRTQTQAVDQQGMKVLIAKLIPELGFHKGCIYILDPESLDINPVIAIGNASLREFGSYHLTPLAIDAPQIVTAFNQREIVPETDGWSTSGGASYAGVFGELHRVGVLWLQVGAENLELREEDILNRFSAIRTSLRDFLKLK